MVNLLFSSFQKLLSQLKERQAIELAVPAYIFAPTCNYSHASLPFNYYKTLPYKTKSPAITTTAPTKPACTELSEAPLPGTCVGRPGADGTVPLVGAPVLPLPVAIGIETDEVFVAEAETTLKGTETAVEVELGTLVA